MIAARCGFDAIFLDLEHSATSLETAASICVGALTAGITPIARVPSHNPFHAARILDTGAQGVMLPHVENAAEAREIVKSLRFPPMGLRSAYSTGPDARVSCHRPRGDQRVPQRTGARDRDAGDPAGRRARRRDRGGARHRHGPHRRARRLQRDGHPRAIRRCAHAAVFEKVARACKAHGKSMGVGGARGDRELQRYLIDLGVRYLTSGSDVGYLMAAGKADVEAIRKIKA